MWSHIHRWLADNKQWVFSGIGVVAVVAIWNLGGIAYRYVFRSPSGAPIEPTFVRVPPGTADMKGKMMRVPVAGEVTWRGQNSAPIGYLGLPREQEKLLDKMVVTKVCVRPSPTNEEKSPVTALNYRGGMGDVPLSRLGTDGCMEFPEYPMKPWGCHCAMSCGAEMWCRVEGYVEVRE